MNFIVCKASLKDPSHQSSIVAMMDAYSSDPMGDGKPLSEFARSNLIQGLQQHPTSLVFLGFTGDKPCGIATCFLGFSTFAAKPLINLSDFYVEPLLRGKGLGRMLFRAIEEEARKLDCCKLTLEVQQNNLQARAIYNTFGFKQAVYAADVGGGGSICLAKRLT